MSFNRMLLRDKILLSAVSGALGTLVMYSVGLPLYFLNLAKIIYLSYSVELFITHKLAQTTPGFILGFLTGIITGSILAFGFKIIIEWTGSDWIWFKSIGYAVFIWFIWVGVARNLMDLTPYLFKDIRTNALLLTQSVIYSLATTYFMIKLSGGRHFIEKGEK